MGIPILQRIETPESKEGGHFLTKIIMTFCIPMVILVLSFGHRFILKKGEVISNTKNHYKFT